MSQWVRWAKQYGVAAAMGAGLACADVPTRPVINDPPVLRETPRFDLVGVGGQDYYADGESGELVPTADWSARITNEMSTSAISCNDAECSATFNASHEGLWHWSKQTLRWRIEEGGSNYLAGNGEIVETGGTSCIDWLPIGFCTTKKQENAYSASATVAGCSAHAKIGTDHQAGWGILATISAGPVGLSLGTFGETQKYSHGESFDETRCTECDNPATPETEECGAAEGQRPYDSPGPGGGGGGGPCPDCVTDPPSGPTTCVIRYWYNKMTLELISYVILYCY